MRVLEKGLRRCVFSALLLALYKLPFLRFFIVKLANGLEGHELYSATLRAILQKYHAVKVGAYSYGPCMKPGKFPAGVVIGRYVSVGPGVQVFPSNHPLDRISMHPFFYSKAYGYTDKDYLERFPVEICADAWIGANAILLHGCRRIGVGAVIGAGAVVTKDVPDFAIVAGVPAKLLGYRFPENIREQVLKSRWWEKTSKECCTYLSEFLKPLTGDSRNEILSKSLEN